MPVNLVDPQSATQVGVGAFSSTYITNPYARRALLAFYAGKNNAAFVDPRVASASYGGLALAVVPGAAIWSGIGIDQWATEAWCLLDPPLGSNPFVLTPAGADTYKVITLLMVSGINQVTPFGAAVTVQFAGTSTTLTPASSEGEVSVDCLNREATLDTPAQGASQTLIDLLWSGGGAPIWKGVSQRAGGPLSSLAWSWANNHGYQQIAFAIKPQIETYRRPVEYTYDIWEANPQVRDAAGRVVPPQQVRANRWMRLLGARQPTSERPLSFVDDDQIAYIESVRYDGGSGTLSIQTNRGEFGEIIVARAAGKSTA